HGLDPPAEEVDLERGWLHDPGEDRPPGRPAARTEPMTYDSYFFTLEFTKLKAQMNDLLAAMYLIFFAAIAGGAFALMTQNLRSSEGRDSSPSPRKRRNVHPEAPQPGEEVLYADFSRERLERMYQQNP
ncbi:MAG: hypothetical protein ACK486_16470, partial [Cyanobacteriota bacterium]